MTLLDVSATLSTVAVRSTARGPHAITLRHLSCDAAAFWEATDAAALVLDAAGLLGAYGLDGGTLAQDSDGTVTEEIKIRRLLPTDTDDTDDTDDGEEDAEEEEDADPIKILIGDGPVTPAHKQANGGWKASLILDPEDWDVSLFTNIGAGTPESAWHGRTLEIGVKPSASGAHLRDLLEGEEAQELLSEIFATYLGRHWNGSNNVGKWERNEHGEMACDGPLDALRALLEGVPCFSSASDWLDPVWSDCQEEVKAAILGATSEEEEAAALDALAEKWVREEDNVILDLDDVKERIASMVEQIDDEETEDGEEGEADLYRVCPGASAPLDTHELSSLLVEAPDLGRSWFVVEASGPVQASRKARALRGDRGEQIATLAALDAQWIYTIEEQAVLPLLLAAVKAA